MTAECVNCKENNCDSVVCCLNFLEEVAYCGCGK